MSLSNAPCLGPLDPYQTLKHIDEEQKGDFHLETGTNSSGCERKQKKSHKIVEEGITKEESPNKNHVKEGTRLSSSLPSSHNPLSFFPPTFCDETVCAEQIVTDKSNRESCKTHCDRKCDESEEKSNDKTAISNVVGSLVNKKNAAEYNNLDKREDSNRNRTAETRGKDLNKLKELAEDETNENKAESSKSGLCAIELSEVSDSVQENKRAAIKFHVKSDTFSTIDEVDPEAIDGDETVDAISAPNCYNRNERSEGEENLLGDSLDVNFDSGSVNTISDEDEDYLCVQYSESDLLKDTETKEQTCIVNGCSPSEEENPKFAEKLTKINETTDRVDENFSKELARKESLSDLNGPCANELKILRYFQTGSLVKDRTESDISAFESFYSLDNSCTPSVLGTPVIKRLKKTLTWTPRILSEERFSSSRSTTLSSDVASFYTAETSGTFFSARSFQLDSCDNFVTCEDFQKLDFNDEPKSKLSKAKDALVKGRDFVKSKIDCYRKRLPSFAKSNKDIKSRILCHNTCGFSCVQVGKEISLYSIPDTQANLKGGNDIEIKGGNKTENSFHNESDRRYQCNAGMSIVSGSGMTVRKVLEEKNGRDGECKSAAEPDFDREDGKFDGQQFGKTAERGDINGKENTQDGQEGMEFLSRETTEEPEDDLPIGTEAMTINKQRSSRDASESEDSRTKKRLRWVSAIERTQGTSLTSSLTTNSRAQQKLWECVDQLLYQREMDPELLLSSLGFGGGVQADDSLSRVPDRFLLSQTAAPSVDQYQLVMNHPELHHLLPVMGTSQLMQGSSHTMPETSHVNTENKQDVVDSAARNQEPRKGQLTSLDNFVEFDNETEPDSENTNIDIPKRFINGNENDQEVPNSSRILELCGIVPERYLIKSSKTKPVNGNSDVDNAITGENSRQLNKEEREASDATHNNTESMPNNKSKSLSDNGSQGKYGSARFDVKDKVSSEKLVVEVEVHDRSAGRLTLDKVHEENCDIIERVNSSTETENQTADIETDNDGPDEVRDHLKDDAEGLKSWSSTSSDSFDDPYTDLQLDDNETVV